MAKRLRRGVVRFTSAHVESVAWVSQRKDVLSTSFGLMSMYAYVAYAQRGSIGRFGLMFALFALGLMAKPMLVTLPLVLLLLDYWPLKRVHFGRANGPPGSSVGYLILEKVPLLLLSAASSIVTFNVQQRAGAMNPGDLVPMPMRLANALVCYVSYMGKMVWPVNLSPLYPHPNLPGGQPWQSWQVVGAGFLLAVICIGVVAAIRRRYLIVGWLWYLGGLVPVIGMIHVGYQAMADRYTYVPLTGVFVMIAWGARDLISRGPSHQRLQAVAALVGGTAVSACFALSWMQTSYWRDAVTLYRHAAEITAGSPVLHYNFGLILQQQDKHNEAIEQYRLTLKAKESNAEAHNRLGYLLAIQGKYDDTIHHLRQALRYSPDHARAHNNLGIVYARQQKIDQANYHFRQAVDINPQFVQARYHLGLSYRDMGRIDEAIEQFRRALELKPDYPEASKTLEQALNHRARVHETRQ